MRKTAFSLMLLSALVVMASCGFFGYDASVPIIATHSGDDHGSMDESANFIELSRGEESYDLPTSSVSTSEEEPSENSYYEESSDIELPEAFYSPVFMRRYINLCQKCRMNLRFLFLEYDGDEALWKFDIPQGMVLGYEVCDTPRSFDLLHCLEREEYTEHREKLNYMGLFTNHADALLYKESYEKEYYSGASPYYRDISPKLKLHVFRLTYIKSFPDYIPPSL